MRELDDLLLRYLAGRYPSAGTTEQAAFRQLLDLSDPELVAYLLKRELPPSEALCDVVRRILEPAPT